MMREGGANVGLFGTACFYDVIPNRLDRSRVRNLLFASCLMLLQSAREPHILRLYSREPVA